MQTITEKINNLPIPAQQVVEELVNLLSHQYPPTQRKKPKLKWAGALKDLRDKYTSVELQHEISKWRTEEEY